MLLSPSVLDVLEAFEKLRALTVNGGDMRGAFVVTGVVHRAKLFQESDHGVDDRAGSAEVD
jgi:hypothetical protein